jgi:heat shock protein HspQ
MLMNVEAEVLQPPHNRSHLVGPPVIAREEQIGQFPNQSLFGNECIVLELDYVASRFETCNGGRIETCLLLSSRTRSHRVGSPVIAREEQIGQFPNQSLFGNEGIVLDLDYVASRFETCNEGRIETCLLLSSGTR